MANHFVLTLTGHDKVGLVDEITNVIVKYRGNVEASRMARLGGEFAVLMLVTVANKNLEDLDQGLSSLRKEGYQISLLETQDDHTQKYAGWLPYEIEVEGADHEGIIHEIAHHLAKQGINIENMDTGSTPAPMSGTPLFTMKAVILIPPKLNFHKWSNALEELGDKLNVDINIEMVK